MKKILVFIMMIVAVCADEVFVAGASELKDNLAVVEQEVFYERFDSELEDNKYRKNKDILVKVVDENSYEIVDQDKKYKASRSYTDNYYIDTGKLDGEYKVYSSSQYYWGILVTDELLDEKDLPAVFYLKEGWQGYSKVEAGDYVFLRESPFTLFRVAADDIGSKYVEVEEE